MIDYDYEDRLVDRIAANEAIAARLNPRQRRVLLRYTRYGETYREIAQCEGLSVERVRQLHFRALDKLCKPLVSEPPKPTTRTEPPVGFDKAAFLRHMRLLIELREQHAVWERQEEARRERERIEQEATWERREFERERAALAGLIERETAKKAPPPHHVYNSPSYPSYAPLPLPTLGDLYLIAQTALMYLFSARPQFDGTQTLGSWCTSVVFTRDGGEVREAVNSIVRELPTHARLSAHPVPIEDGTLGAHAITPYASLRVTVTPDGLKLRFDVTWD